MQDNHPTLNDRIFPLALCVVVATVIAYSLSSFLEIRRNTALLNNPTRLQQISDRIPAGRWGKPEDFAGPVVFLASDASSYVCGELLVVDGVRYLVLTLFCNKLTIC